MKRLRDFKIKMSDWDKKWYSHMMKNGKKVYSYHSKDGRYDITPSGKHPTKGFAHRDKGTWWAVWDNETKKEWNQTFTTYKKAMMATMDR